MADPSAAYWLPSFTLLYWVFNGLFSLVLLDFNGF